MGAAVWPILVLTPLHGAAAWPILALALHQFAWGSLELHGEALHRTEHVLHALKRSSCLAYAHALPAATQVDRVERPALPCKGRLLHLRLALPLLWQLLHTCLALSGAAVSHTSLVLSGAAWKAVAHLPFLSLQLFHRDTRLALPGATRRPAEP